MDDGELCADLTSASQGGGNHITSKLDGVNLTRPACAVDIMYDDNAMFINHYIYKSQKKRPLLISRML